MGDYYRGGVAMSAATSIQIRSAQSYRTRQPSWVDDVRPCFALYMMLAVDERKHAPDWLVTYMEAAGILDLGDWDWRPTKAVLQRMRKMRHHKLTMVYRHGAIVNRLLAMRLAEVDQDSGRLVVVSPSLLWERTDMMSRLYDEAVGRLGWLVERWEDA